MSNTYCEQCGCELTEDAAVEWKPKIRARCRPITMCERCADMADAVVVQRDQMGSLNRSEGC